MAYKIIYEADTSLGKNARTFYMYNEQTRMAKVKVLTPSGIILRNENGRPLEAVLFNIGFNIEKIISKLNDELGKI